MRTCIETCRQVSALQWRQDCSALRVYIGRCAEFFFGAVSRMLVSSSVAQLVAHQGGRRLKGI